MSESTKDEDADLPPSPSPPPSHKSRRRRSRSPSPSPSRSPRSPRSRSKSKGEDVKRIRHLMDVQAPAIKRRTRVLMAVKELLEATEEDEDYCDMRPPSPKRRQQQQQQQQQRVHSPPAATSPTPPPPPRSRASTGRMGNVISVAVLVFAVVLYLAPELIIGHGARNSSGGSGGGRESGRDLHPEWSLQTFETASGRSVWTVQKAVVSDTLLYDKVVETLSYHLVHGKKRVLCMWHLAIPISMTLAHVCVWKRRPTHTTIASLLLSRPDVDEGLLLPLYNLDIKGGFCF